MKLKEKETNQICTVVSDYEHVTNDWNNDGEVYTLYGLWVEWQNGIRDFIEKDEIETEFEIVN